MSEHLSAETLSRLEVARSAQSDYSPNKEVSAVINRVHLVMVIGALATGKSTVMQRIAEIDPRFTAIPHGFVTRPPRDSDRDMEYIPHTDEGLTDLLDAIDQGQCVQYAIHPTTGYVYGTWARDYKTPYKLLATLSGSAEAMAKLPFKSTTTVGIVTSGVVWEHWLENREGSGVSDDIKKRLVEARQSVDWLLEHQDIVRLVINVPGNPSIAAKRIIDVVTIGKMGDAHGPSAAVDLKKAIARKQAALQ